MIKKFLFCFFYGIVILLFSNGTFWEKYNPNEKTILFLDFDNELNDLSPNKNIIKLEGKAQIVDDGYFGKGCYLNEGGIKIEFTTNFPPGETAQLHTFTLQMWIKPERLPEKNKYFVLFDRGNRDEQKWWMQLLLNDEGALIWKAKNFSNWGYYDDFVVSIPNVIEPKKWQHIAIIVGGGLIDAKSNFARIFLNGKNVTSNIYGGNIIGPTPHVFIKGSVTIGLKEKGKTNDENFGPLKDKIPPFEINSFSPYQGYIDEIILEKGIVKLSPLPNNPFLDPEKKKEMKQRIEESFADKDLLLYISFDKEPLCADFSKGDNKIYGIKKVIFEKGVRGNSIYQKEKETGILRIRSKDNFNPEAGSIEFWVCVKKEEINWPSIFMSCSPFYFGPFSLGRNNYWFHGALYPSKEIFTYNQWRHIVFTWNKYICKFFVDGNEMYSVPMSLFTFDKIEDFINIGYWQDYPILFDEIRIYNRPLTDKEIKNHYNWYINPEEILKLDRIGMTFIDMRGVNKIVGSLFSRSGKIDANDWLIKLIDMKDKKNTFESIIPFKKYYDSPFILELPENIKEGSFKFEILLRDTDKKVIEKTEEIIKREPIEWLNNNIGKEERILKPFEPIKFKNNMILIVGRQYGLSKTGLFKEIFIGEKRLLKKPMEIIIEKGDKSFRLNPQGIKILEVKDNLIRWESKNIIDVEDDEVEIIIKGETEYDGCTKFNIQYKPLKENIEVEKFKIVIPLNSEFIEFYSANASIGLPDPDPLTGLLSFPSLRLKQENGEIFSSLKLWNRLHPNNKIKQLGNIRIPTVGNFIPQIWFGNNFGGISIFGDNDKGWVPDDEYPAINLIREGEISYLQLNIIPKNYKLQNTKNIIFGLTVTPVKPLPSDYRTNYKYYGNMGSWGAGTCYIVDPEDAGYNPFIAKINSEDFKKKFFVNTPHLDTTFINWGPKTRQKFSFEWHAGFTHFPYFLLTKSKIDFALYSFKKWKENYNIDGVYFDTATPLPNFNIFSGTAYELEDGRIQPGWAIWNQREFFKRAAHLFGNIYEENFTWGNGFYGPEISGWQGATVVGEGVEFFTKENRELVGRHIVNCKNFWEYYPVKFYTDFIYGDLDLKRVHAVSSQWGIIRVWQDIQTSFYKYNVKNDPPELVERVKHLYRSIYAQLLLLDPVIGFGWQEGAIPKYLRELRRNPDYKFYPFWENEGIFNILNLDKENIYIVGYSGNDEMYIIVSNLNYEKKNVNLEINLDRIGFKNDNIIVEDVEKNEKWEEIPEKVYYQRFGTNLLSTEDRQIIVKRENNKIKINLNIYLQDYRVLKIHKNEK